MFLYYKSYLLGLGVFFLICIYLNGLFCKFWLLLGFDLIGEGICWLIVVLYMLEREYDVKLFIYVVLKFEWLEFIFCLDFRFLVRVVCWGM